MELARRMFIKNKFKATSRLLALTSNAVIISKNIFKNVIIKQYDKKD